MTRLPIRWLALPAPANEQEHRQCQNHRYASSFPPALSSLLPLNPRIKSTQRPGLFRFLLPGQFHLLPELNPLEQVLGLLLEQTTVIPQKAPAQRFWNFEIRESV
jgi:hypothetical protein